MPLAEHLYLGGRERHAPDGTLVENLVFREDELQPPALGAVLERGVEPLSRLGGHALHLDGLSLNLSSLLHSMILIFWLPQNWIRMICGVSIW